MYTLKGSKESSMQIVSSHTIEKMMAKGGTAVYMTMYLMEDSELKEDMSLGLQQLL